MDLTAGIEQGTVHPILLIAVALVLGALHGLEPGHAKTMMAAFIIAVRGTAAQAVLLGLSAALSHSLIVWVLAIAALTLGDALIAEHAEPYFMIASGTIVLAIGAWMFGRLQGERAMATAPGVAGHSHHHSHHHDHHHHDQADDAHARAHAAQIEGRFAGGRASNGQVILFGLSGGLIPCPAAITVLLVCLHLQQLTLGIAMVGAFSTGLALTLIAVGVIAAWGTAFVSRRSGRLAAWGRRLPYLSSLLVGVVGLVMMAAGWSHFADH